MTARPTGEEIERVHAHDAALAAERKRGEAEAREARRAELKRVRDAQQAKFAERLARELRGRTITAVDAETDSEGIYRDPDFERLETDWGYVTLALDDERCISFNAEGGYEGERYLNVEIGPRLIDEAGTQ